MSTTLERERINILYRAVDADVSKVESLIVEEGIDCDFKRVSKLKLSAKPVHYDKLARSQALLATGTSTVGPLVCFRRRIVPVGAFIIVKEPLAVEVLDRLTPRLRITTDTKNFIDYFRITPDNRLLFGDRARFAASSPTSDMKSGVILQRSLLEVFPELSNTRIDYCWGGMVDMTRGRLPRAGVRNGLFYSMGYSGHGTHMSTYLGAISTGRTFPAILASPGFYPLSVPTTACRTSYADVGHPKLHTAFSS